LACRLHCDARDFYDTEEVMAKMFKCDWGEAIRMAKLAKFIMRSDDVGDEHEVEEVEAVMWERAPPPQRHPPPSCDAAPRA